MKLWLIQDMRILGILEDVSMAPLEMLILENPRVPDEHAFLGRSTLMTMRLLTDHHTGALVTPGGKHMKMWTSRELLRRVLTGENGNRGND